MPGLYRKPLRAALFRRRKPQVQQDKQGQSRGSNDQKAPYPPLEAYQLTAELKLNLEQLQRIFAKCSDVVHRDFYLGQAIKAALFYIDGLADKKLIEDTLMRTLQQAPPQLARDLANKTRDLAAVMETVMPMTDVAVVDNMGAVVKHVLDGDTVLLLDGYNKGLALSTRSWEHRTIDEPITESVVRGPRESFIESLRTNTALLRRRLKTPSLKMELVCLGRYTMTNVVITYIEDLADPAVVREVRQRLERIQIDGILESAYIEELIEDNPTSPFPQIDHTERPDKVVAALLEGRVGILVDNTPFALIVPTLFVQFIQSSEDYYERYYLSSFLRLARFVALNIALLLPAAYVAVSTFHQEMLPTNLLVKLASQREGIPFPAVVEAIMLELTFELLREAGVRLPRPVGQALSIVGALVIGEAAVSAGLVSPSMVIVVALTGISSFAIPSFAMAITLRLLRFVMLILAGTLGFYGIMLGLLAILVHLNTLRSFGVPYLAPVTPWNFSDFKDVLVRVPRWAMNSRPSQIGYRDPVRQGAGLKPTPPASSNPPPEEGRS
ncbi:Bacillus/Clostridium Ger spore germination protein [Moorella glycerini]|uniref:Spore germination protein B1 n=1 Tax=Neomoorella stamsii TaxID=1266720 RepID=A0A9X7P4S8_9FIRM|nr:MULTISPECIES: spore germination protein [Moorella]PRR68965.1 Spore germination protein B1 [Moorella stamsii]CEP67586.1 Bacillus/Clostridium Ger spore germination protein [Moorella glycerini]